MLQTKKILTGLVAFAMVFTFVGGSAVRTVSAADAMMSTTAMTTTTTTTSSSAYTRDLTIGSTGADVVALQTMLETGGYLVMPVGVAKGYFGSITKMALMKWQAAVGISPASGYFGPITRAYVATHSSMTTGTTTGTTVSTGCSYDPTTGAIIKKFDVNTGMQICPAPTTSTTTTTTTSTTLSGGEASLEDFDLVSVNDAEEGESKAEVASARFYARDADAKLDRADFEFESTGTGSADSEPWKVFDKAYLMMDGKTVASMDVSDESDWSDEGSDVYRLRFSGLNSIVKEDARAELTLALDVMDNIDDADNASWDVTVPSEGIRAIDGAGIDQYVGDDSDTVSFDINSAGQNEDLTFRESTDNPGAMTLKVETDQTSDWYSVLKFEAEADQSNDVRIKSLPISLAFNNAESYGSVVNDAKLVIDGKEYNDFTVGSTSAGTTTITFDLNNGDDVVVNAGETSDFELMLEFKKTAGNYAEGTTVSADMTSANVDAVDAEGADDLDSTQLKGSVDGDDMTLRVSGITIAKTDDSATEDTGSDTTTTDNQGVFTITFNVTGFDEDMYIPLTAGTGSSTGASYRTETSADVQTSTGTTTAALTLVSGGTKTGNYVRVSDGQTAKFKLTVNYDPTTTDYYRAQLVSVNSNVSAATPNTYQTVGPSEDYETDVVQVRN